MKLLTCVSLLLVTAVAGPTKNPYSRAALVDLGYEVYQGFQNTTTGLNNFLGIRYAADTSGANRFQAPKAPIANRNRTIQANTLPPRCPQGTSHPAPPGYDFTGSEDCLFLSVYSPANATNLPVLVWIHGGGYGEGSGNEDPSEMILANNYDFVAVVIQYRLGAFGFLSSDEVHRFGSPNAGLLDQHFSLQWVQNYIHLFGGDPTRVTISGVSAGAGSVMLHAMAYGGTLGNSLFKNMIAASPYLPMQYGYADVVPTQSYYAFAREVGCFDGAKFDNRSSAMFDCLVSKDTQTLQRANSVVSASRVYKTYGFLPVTDGTYVQQIPSQQLQRKQVNGQNMLVGNNANEGSIFVPLDIVTEDDFVHYLKNTFPSFDEDQIAEVLLYYPSTEASVNPSDPVYATNGISGASALNQSSFATGQLQRAEASSNLYAEATFVCPSYWLAEAFSGSGRSSYKYQFSAVPAPHAADLTAYFGVQPANYAPIIYGPDFEFAFKAIWGNFITGDNPSIPATLANGASSNDTSTPNPINSWPAFGFGSPYQINLNQTGGDPVTVNLLGFNITTFAGPNARNDITLVNAWTWEAGRGARCEFWRSVGGIVPE